MKAIAKIIYDLMEVVYLASRTGRRAKERVEHWGERLEEAKDKGRRKIHGIAAIVEERPLTSVLVVLGLGMLMGLRGHRR